MKQAALAVQIATWLGGEPGRGRHHAARQESSAANDLHAATGFDVVSAAGGDDIVTLDGRVIRGTGAFTKVDLLVLRI